MKTLKEFCIEEGMRQGLAANSIHSRIRKGKYRLKLKKINQRVVFVIKAWKVELKPVEI